MVATTPTPPRLSGDSKQDLMAMTEFMWSLYQALVIENRIDLRTQAMDALTQLDQEISATPTQAEIQAIQTKLNEVIAALQAQ